MRIYTRIVMDMATGAIEEADFYEHAGPIALCGGGKGDAPEAPDYTALAQLQGQSALDAARIGTKANRVDQYTPYGNLIYTQGGGAPVFNQAGYDAALKKFQDAENAGTQSVGGFDPYLNYGATGYTGASTGGSAQAPKQADYWMTQGDPDRWSSQIQLSPTGQQLLDYSNAAALGLGEQTGRALGRVDDTLSQPFDYGSVQQLSDAAYGAQTARLDPYWAQQEGSYDQKLANQGITLGSEAYDNAMRVFNQGRNDAYSRARLDADALMPQTFQLASSLRNQPLNELNALRTGSQVTNPNFTTAPQQQTTPGVNYLGAGQAQYGADMAAYNAQVGQGNSLMGGLFGLGSAALMSPAGTFSWLSDRRLKSNIERIGTHPLGIGLYAYDIFGARDVGVMADEVLAVKPEAVSRHPSGYLMVNYGRL